MENTNINNNKEEVSYELSKINFVPNYSVQYLYDADLAKSILNNLNKRFPRLVTSVIVAPVKNVEAALRDGRCPINIFAQFALNKEMFKANINPKIAAMINADEEFSLTTEAQEKLKPFLSNADLREMEIKQVRIDKKVRCKIISVKLNPYLTLSNTIEIPEGKVFDIMEVKQYTKHNIVIAVRVMKKPEKKKKHNNNNNNNNRR